MSVDLSQAFDEDMLIELGDAINIGAVHVVERYPVPLEKCEDIHLKVIEHEQNYFKVAACQITVDYKELGAQQRQPLCRNVEKCTIKSPYLQDVEGLWSADVCHNHRNSLATCKVTGVIMRIFAIRSTVACSAIFSKMIG